MYLNLTTDRPGRLVAGVALCICAVFTWGLTVSVPAVGGEEPSAPQDVRMTEERLYDLRAEQVVRARRVEILRAQVSALNEAIDDADAETAVDLRSARQELLALLLDGRKAEEEIAASLRQLWEAQGYAQRASQRSSGIGHVDFEWPVEPALGISATFDDPGYRARFGFPHNAIDIPIDQGSVVQSAADGVVETVSDQGMGFNSIIIRHADGYATLYGHVTTFLVAEGDVVHAGDAIALSGGMPGTAGAGRITTGPHLHFEVLKDGVHVDPLPLLPSY